MVRLLKRWFGALASGQFTHIYKGVWNRISGREERLYRSRHEACECCQLREVVEPVGEICGECCCPLQTKLRVPEETCPHQLW